MRTLQPTVMKECFLKADILRVDTNGIKRCRDNMPGVSYSLIVSEHAHAEFEHTHKQIDELLADASQ